MKFANPNFVAKKILKTNFSFEAGFGSKAILLKVCAQHNINREPTY